ncbi:MAG: hypothetical protein ACRC1T_05445 [Clostridium chrysemydis]|uniref:hypothetical protein n=1 Tax=Clostridium chrysemydis TaxID=2665504 RepID=UPI003F3C5273
MMKRIEFGLEECIELSSHAAKEIRCGVDAYMDIKQDPECIMYNPKLYKYKGVKVTKDLNLSDEAIRIIVEDNTIHKVNGITSENIEYINV